MDDWINEWKRQKDEYEVKRLKKMIREAEDEVRCGGKRPRKEEIRRWGNRPGKGLGTWQWLFIVANCAWAGLLLSAALKQAGVL